MTYNETKTEQNQTLSKVPLITWRRFKTEAASKGVTMTQLFIDMFNHWMDKES